MDKLRPDEDREINMREDESIEAHLKREEWEDWFIDRGIKLGKSAAGTTHLATTVLCIDCHMLVELGTDDCPHAVALHKKAQMIAERERRHQSREETDAAVDMPVAGSVASGGTTREETNEYNVSQAGEIVNDKD